MADYRVKDCNPIRVRKTLNRSTKAKKLKSLIPNDLSDRTYPQRPVFDVDTSERGIKSGNRFAFCILLSWNAG